MTPSLPKTYAAECISDRGVVARSTMIVTTTVGIGAGREKLRAPTEGRAEVDEHEAAVETGEVAGGEAVL